MPKTKSQFIYVTLLTFALANVVNLSLPTSKLSKLLDLNDQALARSSGGRTRSGSFRSSPSTTKSNSSPTNTNNNSPTYSPNRPVNNNGGGTTIVPVIIPGSGQQPIYNNGSGYTTNRSSSSSDDGSGWIVFLFLLLLIGGIGAAIYFMMRAASKKDGAGELGNNTVTVSKLQVALLAEARAVQSKLTDITMEADTNTPEGLSFLAQESALALLRTPENWTHVLASSEAMSKEKAEEVFDKISIEERTKFSAETLVNVGGRVRNQSSFTPDPNEDPAAYIVVTLLIGTEHDKPLFGEITSSEALHTALEKIASVSPEYLLVFELLWSPQAQEDSLTYDELLTEYTNMVQI